MYIKVSVLSTSFAVNVGTYMSKAGYAALSSALSTGTAMLFTDIFTNGKEIGKEDWGIYLKGMGLAAGISFGMSFVKSMIDYGTWDMHSVDKKMEIIQKKYGENVRYNSNLAYEGLYTKGNDYVELGTLALSEDRGYAFSVARHELKHLRDYNRYGDAVSNNFLEIRAYKHGMRYYRSTSQDYLRSLKFIRHNHEYKGFGVFNPFIFLNSIF